MRFWGFLLFLILAAGFVFTDFPGAKIILYAMVIFIIVNRVYIYTALRKISLERAAESGSLFIGMRDENKLTVSNGSHLPLHAVSVSDRSDLRVSDKTTYTFIASADGSQSFTYSYFITGRKRGKFTLGPASLTFSDPAGFFQRTIDYADEQEIIVFPRLHRFAGMGMKSFQPLGSIRSPLPIFEDHTLLTGTRNFQPGDDMRTINWKASARRGRHIVNTYQSTVSAESLIFLNLHADNYPERHRNEHTEDAIECAASLISYLFGFGQKTGVCINGSMDEKDTVIRQNPERGNTVYAQILTSLALVGLAKETPGYTLFESSPSLTWGCCIYYITAYPDEKAVAYLMGLAAKGHPVSVIGTDPDPEKSLPLHNVGIYYYHAQINDGVIRLSKA